MKKRILQIVLVALIGWVSHMKAESAVSEMKAQIDGVDWAAYIENTKYTPTVSAYITEEKNKKYAVDIKGTREVYEGTTLIRKESITLNVKITGAGTYTLAGYNAAGYGQFYKTEENTANKSYQTLMTNESNTGTLTITEFDLASLKISGTFSFKAYHKDYKTAKESRTSITNGSFTTSSVSVSNAKIAVNDFSANLNGSTYSPYSENEYKNPISVTLRVDKSNPAKIKYSLDIYTTKEIYESTTLLKTESVIVNAKITGTGTYLLGGYNAPGYGQVTSKEEAKKDSYLSMQTNQENTGSLVITEFDPSNMRIAGTFNFKAYHKDYKTAKESRSSVSEGKFAISGLTYTSY